MSSMARILTDRDPGDEARAPLDVIRWRYEELCRAGYPAEEAILLAERPDVDLHGAVDLIADGASISQALRILL